MNLFDYQKSAINNLDTGKILCGGVGSGKSLTALAYYYIKYGGNIETIQTNINLPDLYIITTARKRDTFEWDSELNNFLLTRDENNPYSNKVIVDSWNNVKKYIEINNAFFIFDEQRVVGKGSWVKSFLKITNKNDWILLSATPGDTWSDYIPVFIANGFYKNRTEFTREHIIYNSFTNFPKVDRYINTGRLLRLRNKILVDMDFSRKTISHHEDIYVTYDISMYKDLIKTRWNIFKDEPITNVSELCYCLRKVVNSDPSRELALLEIIEKHPKAIVFYNFDYELDILTQTAINNSIKYTEWNGHKHQEIPKGNKWLYFVQYTAGAEGWNCITTDTIIFYSQNYSYKILTQSCGRIDRLNTPYIDLYYYHLKSRSGIDLAISKAIKNKKKFNETRFINTKNTHSIMERRV